MSRAGFLKFAAALVALALSSVNSVFGDELRFGDYVAKGFLSDYSKLAPEGGDSPAFKYRDAAVDFSKYDKLLVDRIQIWVKEDAEYKGIDPTVLKELTDYFHAAIVKAMADAYPVVDDCFALTTCADEVAAVSAPGLQALVQSACVDVVL